MFCSVWIFSVDYRSDSTSRRLRVRYRAATTKSTRLNDTRAFWNSHDMTATASSEQGCFDTVNSPRSAPYWIGSCTSRPEFPAAPDAATTQWLFDGPADRGPVADASLSIELMPSREVRDVAFTASPDVFDLAVDTHLRAVDTVMYLLEEHAVLVWIATSHGVAWCDAVGLAGIATDLFSQPNGHLSTSIIFSHKALSATSKRWLPLVLDRLADWIPRAREMYARAVDDELGRQLGSAFGRKDTATRAIA